MTWIKVNGKGVTAPWCTKCRMNNKLTLIEEEKETEMAVGSWRYQNLSMAEQIKIGKNLLELKEENLTWDEIRASYKGIAVPTAEKLIQVYKDSLTEV
jgi:hypothetical protein